jgi:N-acetylmuramoyl-L-alanine amidase
MKIALDAGHGNGDPGAVNKELGLTEADVAYSIVQAVKKGLSGYDIIETNRSLYSDQRARTAWREGAQVLVSIHLNAGPPEAQGYEIWFHHGNKGGEKLADRLDRAMASFLPVRRGVKDDYYWRPASDPNWTGGMGILREFPGAACLVEVLFITNISEARACLDQNFIKKVGELIAMGIKETAQETLFPDVKDPQVREALLKLYDKQIVKGYPDGTFHPDEPLTRGQMVILISRLLTYLGKE